ncbi:hypothetical protein Sjap_016805 [Stephania japonica]|uniref:Vacuolar protein sorting-associated protein 13 VPS13 adaptor binding domain-containing protein n=1 Tax=Stephania japonica TaxID=461633 RepID=A0AAP0NJK4_9MAGN
MFKIRSKLASILRPWMQSEPDLDLNLGFLSSHGSAQNLVFDVSALDGLIGDSTCLSFKEVRVEKLSFRASPWSATAFTVDVQGVYVALNVREPSAGRRSWSSGEWSEKEKKEILSVIDPEGIALHDLLERISNVPPKRNWLMTSLLNVVLKHSQLQVRDIHIELKIPGRDDSIACFLKTSDFSLKTLHHDNKCLLSGLFSTLFLYQNIFSLLLNTSSLELGFEREECLSRIVSSFDLSGCFKYKDLQLLNLDVHVPQLDFTFSPMDLPVILTFYTLLTKKVKTVRNGRELWGIAARKICSMIRNPKISFHKLVDSLGLWLHHVRTYESFLLLVGYPIETTFGKSSVMMSLDCKYSAQVKNHWKSICGIEKDMLVDALARSRRIARRRAAIHGQRKTSGYSELQLKVHEKLFWKLLFFLSFLLKSILSFLKSVIHFLSLVIANKDVVAHELMEDTSGCSGSHHCFAFRKVTITVSPTSSVPSFVNGWSEMPINFCPFNLLSFCVVLDCIFLVYIIGSAGHTLSFSCGDLNIKPSTSHESLTVPPSVKNWKKETSGSFKRRGKEGWNDMKVLWFDPAAKSLDAEKVAIDSPSRNAFFSCLERHLEKLWSGWKKQSENFASFEAQYLENPILLCEIRSAIMNPFLASDCGQWQFVLSMGKLNIDLGYSAIISVSLLLWQIQYALSSSKKRGVVSHSPSIKEVKEINLDDCFESYVSGMKMLLYDKIPEKKIQMGVIVGGATVQVSLQEEELLITNGQGLNHIFNQGHSDLCIMLNLESTELVVWPSSKPSCESIQEQILDDAVAEIVQRKRSRSHKTSGSDIRGNYISSGNITHNSCLIMNGFKTYWKNLEAKQFQVVGLKSVFVQSSFGREYVYSLMTNITTLSASLRGMVTGVIVSSYMDELCLIFQAVSCMHSAALYTFKSINTMGRPYFHEEEQVAIVKGSDLILKSTRFRIDISYEFSSLVAIMNGSRRGHATENLNKFNGASSDSFLSTLVAAEHGIGVAVGKQQAHVSFNDESATLKINISKIHSVIFRYQSLDGEGGNEFNLSKLFNQSPYCLYELSVSDCSFVLSTKSSEDATSSGRLNTAVASTSGSGTYNTVHPISAILADIPDIQLCAPNNNFIQNDKRSADHLPLSSAYQFLMDVIIGEIYVVEHSLKNVLLEAHEPEKLHSSLSVDGGLKTVSWTIQGGIVFVDMAAFATFICCFRAYFQSITNFSTFLSLRGKSYGRQSIALEPGKEVGEPSSHSEKRFASGSISLPVQDKCNSIPASKWKVSEACMIKLSQTLVLVVADKPGEVRGIELKVDLHFRLELMNLRRRVLFDLCHLAIISRCHHYNFEEQITVEEVIPHFSPVAVNVLSRQYTSVESTLKSKQKRSIASLSCGGHTSSSTAPQQESTTRNDVPIFSHSNCGKCILENGAASIQIEKDVSGKEVGCLWVKENCWVGHGSISGFDLTFSLSELQMLLSLFAPLSGVSDGDSSVKSKQRSLRKNQEKDNSSELTVPDGAIVAIQDLHQHMYFAVEGVEDKYYLSGAIHYSLIGERALFRVKYCNRKRWGMPASCFTLESVHAKSSSGEPFRLNYCPGSGFVNISSTLDNGRSLWKKLPYKPENSTGDEDVESHIHDSKNAFYLINHKYDQAVAFVDGVPEFVKKPGDPFKFKIFGETGSVFRVADSLNGDGTMDLTHCLHGMDQASNQGDDLPYARITIDKVTVTIVHELPGAIDKFPLLQACIDSTELIVQVFPMKTRVMSNFTTSISHFNVQGNLWTEIVQPVEICTFYHSRIVRHDNSEIVERGKPVHFHFRSKKVNVLLTGLSLDIILFVVGELDLAGPYAVRSSMIFANCCKVENHSGLSLLCHFYDDQEATVAGKQSTSIFLSQTALASRQLEKSSFASLQFAAAGPFRTSAINVSLKSAGSLAWRTRVISFQDSKTYPGPFVVVHISKKKEDGFAIKVSPLLRIHNETGFPLAIRFCRPQQEESESAFISLRTGDAIDDSMAALDAINLSGGSKKALMSLCLGNFQLSFRPEIPECLCDTGKPVSSAWSGDLKGGKAFRLSGVLDKLTYRFKNVLGVGSMKYSFSTVHCSLSVDGVYATDLYFLIQTVGRDVPVIQPNGAGSLPENRNSPIALQEQKEIFLLPTFQISNNLQSEIHVILTETHPDLCTSEGLNNMGKQSTIACGATEYLYANPSIVYFTVTLTTFNSRCKPVNSRDWPKMLQKQKNDIHYLDIELDFGGGKYFAYLRLSQGERGILEAVVFTQYTLQNDSDLTFLCFASNQKALSRTETEQCGLSLPPNLGSVLPAKSITSWFIKSNRVNLTMLEERVSVALLDLDILSGFTEICLEVCKRDGTKHILKLGISLKPCFTKVVMPSQTVLIVPRYIVSNESEETIFVRQCYLEDDTDGSIAIESKMKAPLWVKTGISERKELNTFDYLLRKHRNHNEDSLTFIQFCLNNDGWSWSGPICIASLGRFFLKFGRSLDSIGNNSNIIAEHDNRFAEIALVHAVEEGSSLVLHFHRPVNINFPYRIENLLHNATITYYQKDSSYLEILGSGNSVDYVWDNLNLPHQLVVQITDLNISREINIDKLHSWKPFYKVRQQRGLALDFPLEKKLGDHKNKYQSYGPELLKVGYEVYADGSTRVLRISEFPDRCKDDSVAQPCAKFQLVVPHLAIHLLETQKQDEEADTPTYCPFLILRLGNINLSSTFTDLAKYNKIKTQLLIVEEKWVGAPFAAMLRRNQLDYSDTNANILEVTFILLPTNSDVKQVKHASIVLQPIDLNIDEETLMRLVPFWRSSLSESNSRSKQFYFKHFEIHPIKIVASFLPGSSDSTYSSAQETLRSLLHSVIKIPAVKNMNVELNGVLVTHALLTARELFIKCAQHYSWYSMRAVYIAKGSPLLPPAFASIFDDSASSSLDVFFDPSSGLINLPGLTLGMFKFISKSINKKGFSGTKRYFGDLSKTMKTAGSNVLFAAITEISDCVIKGAEASGFNGMVNGFHQGILKLAMEPSLLRSAVMEGGPDRKIKLDSSPGVDELYIEGYLQAMLDTLYMQEYLRVKVIDDLVIIKNLPPNSSLMNEIIDRVKDFLISKALLKGELSTSGRPFRHLRGENEWKIGPTMLTLWQHLFVSFAIRMLKQQARKFTAVLKQKGKLEGKDNSSIDDVKLIAPTPADEKGNWKLNMRSGLQKFVFSGLVAYIDGRLCRCIPNAIARRIVSGFLLSLLDNDDNK